MIKSWLKKPKNIVYYVRSNQTLENIIASILLCLVFFISSIYEIKMPSYEIVEGQVSDIDVIAPFSFEVFKDNSQLQLEKKSLINSLNPVYSKSQEINFEVINNLNSIFTKLFRLVEAGERERLKKEISNLGYEVNYTELNYVFSTNRMQGVWEYMMVKSDSLLKLGIVEIPIDETILIERDGRAETVYSGTFNSVAKGSRQAAMQFKDDDVQGLLEYIFFVSLSPNVVINQYRTDELVKGKNEKITSVLDVVQKNEIIIRKNTKVTHLDYMKYTSMLNSEEYLSWQVNKRTILLKLIGYGLLAFLILTIFRYTLSRLVNNLGNKAYLLLLILFIVEVSLYLAFDLLTNISPYIFPILFFVLLPALVLSTKIGFIYSLFLLFINLLTFKMTGSVQLFHVFVAMSGLVLIDRFSIKKTFGTMTWTLIGSGFVIVMMLGLTSGIPFLQILNNFIYTVIGFSISLAGIISLSSWIESKLDIISNNQLLSLLDFNHPLLKKLATEAPGTYHHSLVVSNLAERAAEEIGADYLLARVGSFYHDIGKLKNPKLFTENNEDSDMLHDALSFTESAEIIKDHVSYGMQLAKQSGLPKEIIEIIRDHHGTQAIRYFLKKAQESNQETPQNIFYYNGPKPVSKISVIIMIADIVESKTKVFNEFNPEIVEKTIDELIANKQFAETQLSFRELKQIKEVMNVVLGSIYRKRKDYKLED